MKEPSNLPPGVTDRMIEEQVADHATNKERYAALYQELDDAINEEYRRHEAAWAAKSQMGGDAVMLDNVPPPDEDAIARRVIKESLDETSLVAIARYARALGAWEQSAEWDDDEERSNNLGVECVLAWRLAVLSLVDDGEWGEKPEKEAEQFLSRLFKEADFQGSE